MNGTGIVLHGIALSGHTHRVRLMLRALGLDHRFEEADGPRRQSAAFLAMNPLGQIPVLEDGPVVLADSNAILVYLVRRYAPGSGWLPDDPEGAAAQQRWLSLAAGELRYGPALARLAKVFGVEVDARLASAAAARLFGFMEGHLQDRRFLADGRPTVADIAMHSYVAHAPEGGLSLAPYPNIRGWLAAVAAEPWFEPMPASPVPEPEPA